MVFYFIESPGGLAKRVLFVSQMGIRPVLVKLFSDGSISFLHI